ncbi:hypothetical protein B0H19DRAFT_685586 [Mycena capillaripes]|nr:hypothetical protein B0H19DRAFT_685586 [Mycena capillaripes]
MGWTFEIPSRTMNNPAVQHAPSLPITDVSCRLKRLRQPSRLRRRKHLPFNYDPLCQGLQLRFPHRVVRPSQEHDSAPDRNFTLNASTAAVASVHPGSRLFDAQYKHTVTAWEVGSGSGGTCHRRGGEP